MGNGGGIQLTGKGKACVASVVCAEHKRLAMLCIALALALPKTELPALTKKETALLCTDSLFFFLFLLFDLWLFL